MNSHPELQFYVTYFIDKKYHSDKHEAHRKGIFKKNMDWVKRHNANGAHSYKLEINKFADLTSEEFNAIYNGYKEPVSKTVIQTEFTHAVYSGNF